MLKIVVLDPLFDFRVFTEKELEVNENKAVGKIIGELLPRLTKKSSYYTQFERQQVTIERQPPRPRDASLTIATSPSITEQLTRKFGRHQHKPELQTFNSLFNRPIPYLLGPASTFGEESQMEEVAEEFVSLMRQARLDNDCSLNEQGIDAESRVYLSVDIDAPIRCSTCNKPMKLGHLYKSLGTHVAELFVELDAFCPNCGWQRNVLSLPPAVVSVRDKIRGKRLEGYEQGTQLVIVACNYLSKRAY